MISLPLSLNVRIPPCSIHFDITCILLTLIILVLVDTSLSVKGFCELADDGENIDLETLRDCFHETRGELATIMQDTFRDLADVVQTYDSKEELVYIDGPISID